MRLVRIFRLLIAGMIVWPVLVPQVRADNYDRALDEFESRELTDADLDAGWISLFDAESLFGWRNEGDADFHVVDAMVQVTSGTAPCLLRTTTQFDDYVLRVDFLSDSGTNSGIFLHTSPRPERPDIDCYELNIADTGTNPFPTGSLVGRALVQAERDQIAWQSFEVHVVGERIRVLLDGEELLDYVDDNPLGRGFIGLQYNSGRVAFGNIFLRPLVDHAAIDDDLTQWTRYPELDGEFGVDDEQVLHVRGGRGQLETKQAYADFVLQLQCKTHAAHLNGGVFFRCIPGELMNGYESQIHNGFLDNDRTRPVDCGTGGIFRRVDARRVVADDGKWFRKTLIAIGPHFSVWVDGYQVTDWTDRREPHDNPRRGRRLKAGTIILQAHDPTTDISFRDMRVREINPRTR